MVLGREGGSIMRPPLLDGTNYAYWKARMRVFIKSIDEKAQRSIVTGWTPQMTKIRKEKETSIKTEDKWSTEEERLANANAKALNAIFTAVDVNQFKIIATCESAIDAWNILETAYEGTTAVKVSKLQILATRFEDLKMKDDETISKFKTKLCDIANEVFALGEKYSDAKLVRKTLCSLPSRFDVKVAAIEEAKDMDSMRLDELMGSPYTFELKFKQLEKDKGIALQVGYQNHERSDMLGNDDELEKQGQHG